MFFYIPHKQSLGVVYRSQLVGQSISWLEFGMSYCNQTYKLATLCRNPGWHLDPPPWGQGHRYKKEKWFPDKSWS
jgi:hypothetical protein